MRSGAKKWLAWMLHCFPIMKKQPADAKTPLRAAPADAPERPGACLSYDELLDLALELTFPASDPIAVNDGCAVDDGRRASEREAGNTGAPRPRGRARD
jgi:hypothetical protein